MGHVVQISLIRDWDETTKDVIFFSRAYFLFYRDLSAYTNRFRV